MKTYTLRLRAADKEIFDALKSGKKSVETRAATSRNVKIAKGDELVFVCGKERLRKTVAKATVFRSIGAMLKKYRVTDIAPHLKTEGQLRDMYFSWPSYRDKIKEYGLIALELE